MSGTRADAAGGRLARLLADDEDAAGRARWHVTRSDGRRHAVVALAPLGQPATTVCGRPVPPVDHTTAGSSGRAPRCASCVSVARLRGLDLPDVPSRVARQPSVARAHDCALGGRDHYPCDRAVLDGILAVHPGYRSALAAARDFAGRAATRFVQSGIGQLVDLGSGILRSPTVHQVARAADPTVRVVYVDDDPTAYAHGVLATSRSPGLRYLRHDVADAPGLLRSMSTDGGLDLDQPIGVLACSVLHLLADEDVTRLVAGLGEVAAPGSRLAVGVLGPSRARRGSRGGREAGHAADVTRLGRRVVGRSVPQARALLGDVSLLPPGLVDPRDWPGGPAGSGAASRGAARSPVHVGVARLPAG